MSARIKSLRQERADLAREVRAMVDTATAEKRDLNEEEGKKRTAAMARLDALGAEISEEEKFMDIERSMGAVEEPTAPLAADIKERDKRKAEAKGEKPTGDGFDSLGHLLQAVAQADNPHYRGPKNQNLQAAVSGLNEGTGADGGFIVGQERISAIRERAYETGEILKRVNKQPVGAGFNGVKLYAIDETSRADGSRFGGIRSYWTAEGGEKLASKPAFREMDLRLKKLAALVYTTDELLQDAVALESFINRILPQEIMFRVEDAILNGTGAGMPLGILNSGATISVTAQGGPGTFTYEDAVNMWSRLYAPSRANAVWLVNQGVETALFTMTMTIGTGGVPVYMPAGMVSGQPFSSLFGRPIIPVEYNAALGTVGDVMLADLSQYTLIDKGGVQAAQSMHVRFIYDETVFRFVYRVDGMPDWNSALTPRAGSTYSPFVVLGTRV